MMRAVVLTGRAHSAPYRNYGRVCPGDAEIFARRIHREITLNDAVNYVSPPSFQYGEVSFAGFLKFENV